MTNRAKLQRLPIVITQLRQRAGYRTQGAAVTAIQKATGTFLNKAQISQWERGKSMPSLASLLTFLEGLGYSFQDFQDELDRASGLDVAAPAAAAEGSRTESELARRVEALEERLRTLDDSGSGG